MNNKKLASELLKIAKSINASRADTLIKQLKGPSNIALTLEKLAEKAQSIFEDNNDPMWRDIANILLDCSTKIENL